MWVPAAIIVLGVAAAWLVARRYGGTTPDVAAAIAVLVALAGILERWLSVRRSERTARPSPTSLDRERLEDWLAELRIAVLRARVEAGGQLDQMVRRGDVLPLSVGRVQSDVGFSSLPVDGQLSPWDDVKNRWNENKERLVILGDPGYGKTVAALTLVARINARHDRRSVVAELFPLADWNAWQRNRTNETFGDWLAAQLILTYSQLPLNVARQLIAEGLVLPVLDGLDDVPVDSRPACLAAIEAYRRRTEPHRPLVLTCRAADYVDLARPGTHANELAVVIAGLQPAQVDAILAELTGGSDGWAEIRARHAARDPTLLALFRNPLHLTIALDVYRTRNPKELADLDAPHARARLWDLLLSTHSEPYDSASPEQIRAWLTFLAAAIRRTGRQRFALYDLRALEPDEPSALARFRVTLGLVMGFVDAVVYAVVAGLVFGFAFGVTSGLIGAVWGALGGLIAGAAPAVRPRVPWRTRARNAIKLQSLLGPLVIAVIGGSLGGVFGGVPGGLAFALVAGVFAVLLRLVSVVEVIDDVPPPHVTRQRPDGLLIASRNSGLLAGLAFALVAGPIFGCLAITVDESGGGLAVGLAVGLTGGLVGAPTLALVFGADAWLYHYWLRWRLRARGLIPPRLPEFLQWCAEPTRQWLRVTDAYEFRHRELLDHLAPDDGVARRQAPPPAPRLRVVFQGRSRIDAPT